MTEFLVKHAGTITILFIAVSSIASFIIIYKRDKKYNVPKKDYVIGVILALLVAAVAIYLVVSAYK